MRKEKLVAIVAMVALVVAFISGILLSISPEAVAVMMIHKLSAVILVLGTIVHLWQHSRKGGRP